MSLACRYAHRRAGPRYARLAATLVSGPAGRGVHGHLRSRLVFDELGESVRRVGVSAGCGVAHVRVVVEVLRFCDHVLDDGFRVGVPVKAEAAAVATVVDLVCVGLGVAHDHFAEEAVVV